MGVSWEIYLEMLLRVVVASACGACIGIERSKRFKEAGIRTHVIICAAAALMMIVSKYGFIDLNVISNGNGLKGADPARIAAQVVSGISFLGAGVIFKNGGSIKGLTTAAGVWATAGIGLTIGAGLYFLGIFTTIFLYVLQFVMHRFAIGGDALSTIQVSFEIKNTSELRKDLDEFLKSHNVRVADSKARYTVDGYAVYEMTLRTRDEELEAALDEFLRSKGEVKSISTSTTA
ncbi:MAG: MgtC/SapB family protein [Lachnospiraceae bacterium]|nr:MgtC/SapB family protein [Lachnospiraceae bacterium]